MCDDFNTAELNAALIEGAGAARDYGLGFTRKRNVSDTEIAEFKKRTKVFLEELPDYVSVRDILDVWDNLP